MVRQWYKPWENQRASHLEIGDVSMIQRSVISMSTAKSRCGCRSISYHINQVWGTRRKERGASTFYPRRTKITKAERFHSLPTESSHGPYQKTRQLLPKVSQRLNDVGAKRANFHLLTWITAGGCEEEIKCSIVIGVRMLKQLNPSHEEADTRIKYACKGGLYGWIRNGSVSCRDTEYCTPHNDVRDN
ncbi:hypothetical protein GWK47_017720 [Chionoecetes opilio]|uniref:Uncharacterized protein n=1 Tax=Chionoecetes opilio TaxID=41210 RepID=A0A8J4XTL7_CHIOP|nr:hypothetical protein GWK47_017720 [Chionoecetes opilio]